MKHLFLASLSLFFLASCTPPAPENPPLEDVDSDTLAPSVEEPVEESAEESAEDSQGDLIESSVAVFDASDASPVSGEIKFIAGVDGIKVRGELKGLTPDTLHGFHIHETGLCEGPDFKSAGGHFSPDGSEHGLPDAEKKHAGDMGNISSNSEGVADVNLEFKHFVLKEGERAINGKALIIHAFKDTGKGTSGEAGPRIGCAVIKTEMDSAE